VFIHIYDMETPFDSRLTWRMNDSLDQKVARAMLSTIIVGSPQVNWTKIAAITATVQDYKFAKFGKEFPSLVREKNEFQVSCAEAAEAAVMILNESCMTAGEECTSGKFLTDRMLGKNFSLTSRFVQVTNTGVKVLQAIVQQLSPDDLEIKDIFVYDSKDRVMVPDSQKQILLAHAWRPPATGPTSLRTTRRTLFRWQYSYDSDDIGSRPGCSHPCSSCIHYAERYVSSRQLVDHCGGEFIPSQS
ncbi:hypothetical protein BV898_16138, partial [Hypsibius exemplaris]